MFDNKLTKIKHLTVFSNKLPDLIRLLTSHHLVVGSWIDFETQKNALKKAHTHTQAKSFSFTVSKSSRHDTTRNKNWWRTSREKSFLSFLFYNNPSQEQVFWEEEERCVKSLFSLVSNSECGNKILLSKVTPNTHTHVRQIFLIIFSATVS